MISTLTGFSPSNSTERTSFPPILAAIVPASLSLILISYETPSSRPNVISASSFPSTLNVTLVSVAVLVLAVLASLSLTLLFPVIFDKTLFEWLDFITATILLPLGGVAVSLFVGWYVDKRILLDVLQQEGTWKFRFFKTYIFLLRYLAPVCIMLVFVHNLFA